MRVYFDYNATAPLAPEVLAAVADASRDIPGNASSVHHFGQQAKAALDEARSALAALIHGEASELVFTSGGTESDNFAIRGVAEALEATGRRHPDAADCVRRQARAEPARRHGERAGNRRDGRRGPARRAKDRFGCPTYRSIA